MMPSAWLDPADLESELAAVRAEFDEEVERFRHLGQQGRRDLRRRLVRHLSEDLAPDINAAFDESMRRWPPRSQPAPSRPPTTHAIHRPRATHRETRSRRTSRDDTPSSDDDPAPSPDSGADETAHAANHEQLLGLGEPLTDPEKQFLAALAQLAVQATLGDLALHAEDQEQQSTEGEEP